MKLEGLRQKLVRAARQQTMSEQVPYAFEQRILHAIRSAPPRDPFLAWVAGLWRAAFCALAIAAATGTWHWGQTNDSAPPIETLVIADADLLEVAVLGDLPELDEPLAEPPAP